MKSGKFWSWVIFALGVVYFIGPLIATIRPGGEGVRLFDVATGARFADLAMPGRKVVNLFATPDGSRLITIEQPPGRPGGGGNGGKPPGLELYRVSLWDTKNREAPLKVLAEFEPKTDVAPPPRVPET